MNFGEPAPPFYNVSAKRRGMEYLVRARVGGAKHTFIDVPAFIFASSFAFEFLSKKSPLQKVFGLNLSIHAREARGNPIPPYAALRAARISGGETPLALKLESLLYSARTYFSKNPD